MKYYHSIIVVGFVWILLFFTIGYTQSSFIPPSESITQAENISEALAVLKDTVIFGNGSIFYFMLSVFGIPVVFLGIRIMDRKERDG